MKPPLDIDIKKLTPSEYKAKFNGPYDKGKIKRLGKPVLLKQIIYDLEDQKTYPIISPRRSQKEALKKVDRWHKKGHYRICLDMPVAIGKTITMAFLIKKYIRKHPGKKILFTIHLGEGLGQCAEDLEKIFRKPWKKFCGKYQAKEKNISKTITLATIQTLSKRDNLTTIPKDYFDFIIIDECHHMAAETYQRVLRHFEFIDDDGNNINDYKYLLGLTGTPERLDGKDIGKFFDETYSLELEEGIKRGELSEFEYYILPDNIDYDIIYYNGYKYDQTDLHKQLLIDAYDNMVIREFKAMVKDRQTLGFCASVKHINRMVHKFNQSGIRAAGVTYKTKKYERTVLVDAFKAGDYQVLFTVDLFNEVMNVPEIEALLMMRYTISRRIWEQQFGRGLRILEGKEYCLVLDFIGNSRHAEDVVEWLHEIITKGEGHKKKKPLYNYNIPHVHVRRKAQDILEMLRKRKEMMKPVTKEEVIEEYKRLRKRFGRVPKGKEFKYLYWVKKYYKSWNEFVREMGNDPPYEMGIPKEEIIKEYKELRKRFNRVPTEKEFKHTSPAIRYYGSWNNFIIAMGDDPPYKMNIPKEEIIKEYKELRKKLGRVPRSEEFEREFKHMCPIVKYHGSWTKFVKAMGDKPYYERNIPKEKLIEEYKELRKKLGRVPIKREFQEEFKHTSFITKYYVSWKNFVIAMGDRSYYEVIPKEKLIEEYKELRKRLDRIPYMEEFRKEFKHISFVKKYYRSWNEFVREMGDDPPYNINTPKEEIIKEYKELREMFGRVPTYREFQEEFKHIGFITKYYVSWKNFVKAMGDKPYCELIPKEKLIEEYKELRKRLDRIPYMEEFRKEFKHIGFITKYYGGWKNFVKAMGDRSYYEVIPKEKIIEEYKELRKKLGRVPIKREFEREFKHTSPICRHYGGWKNFVIAMGDKPCKHSGQKKKKREKKHD